MSTASIREMPVATTEADVVTMLNNMYGRDNESYEERYPIFQASDLGAGVVGKVKTEV